jgi:hypothetical protein
MSTHEANVENKLDDIRVLLRQIKQAIEDQNAMLREGFDEHTTQNERQPLEEGAVGAG